jgi:hypothetical protein
MLALLIGMTAIAGANIGPIELIVWFGILLLGLLLIAVGSRSAQAKN